MWDKNQKDLGPKTLPRSRIHCFGMSLFLNFTFFLYKLSKFSKSVICTDFNDGNRYQIINIFRTSPIFVSLNLKKLSMKNYWGFLKFFWSEFFWRGLVHRSPFSCFRKKRSYKLDLSRFSPHSILIKSHSLWCVSTQRKDCLFK